MTDPITLVLPYPLSANRYWKAITIPGRTMMAPSKEAKEYRAEVLRIATRAGVIEPICGRVRIDIELYPARPADWARRARMDPIGWDNSVRCIDLDNARKVLYDALKGAVIEDDRWVFADSARRMEPDGEARVVVKVSRIVRQAPQGALFHEGVAA